MLRSASQIIEVTQCFSRAGDISRGNSPPAMTTKYQIPLLFHWSISICSQDPLKAPNVLRLPRCQNQSRSCFLWCLNLVYAKKVMRCQQGNLRRLASTFFLLGPRLSCHWWHVLSMLFSFTVSRAECKGNFFCTGIIQQYSLLSGWESWDWGERGWCDCERPGTPKSGMSNLAQAAERSLQL